MTDETPEPFKPINRYRPNLMLLGAYVGLSAAIGTMIAFDIDANTAEGGMLIMVAGKFLSMIGTAFDHDFGSSIGSKIKDMVAVVTAKKEAVQANTAAVQADTAAAVQKAADGP